MAFYSQSASLALSTKPVAAFDGNFDLESLQMFGGSDIRANHSYQFMHYSAETWDFYAQLKADLGFDATNSLPAIVGGIVATDKTPQKTPQELLNWFLEPISVPMRAERDSRKGDSLVLESTGLRLTPLRPSILDYYHEMASDDRRSPISRESPSRELPDSLDVVFESLEHVKT